MRRRIALAAALAVLSFCAPRLRADVTLPTGFVDDTLLTGLSGPTSMAFLPDGRLLITEQRTGWVRLFVNGHIAATDPVLVVPELSAEDYESGLQYVAVDPGWPERPYAYFYYNRVGGFCRLVRYRASGDLSDPLGESLAFGDSLLLLDDIPDNDSQHNAGCLLFGPGNYLFVSVGDDRFDCAASDSTSLLGAVLRLDVSRLPEGPGGQVSRELITPALNPLVASHPNARLVWAYGMRNPWRFGIDQVNGTLFVADVGESYYDEFNEVLPGDFLGWPWREGPEVHLRVACPEPGGSGANDFKRALVDVNHGKGPKAINTAGMYRPVPGAPDNWPQNYHGYFGDIFYGDYYGGYLRRMKRLSGFWGVPPPAYGQPNATDWATGLDAAVDFKVGPDGSLWWLSQFDPTWGSETGSVQRIRWVGFPPGVGVDDAAASSDLALGAAPNPFRAATRVAFRMPAREHVTLAVYDLVGRRVRQLIEGDVPAGESAIEWDGRNDRGEPAGPGLYFVRLRRGAESGMARVLRLR